MAFVKKMYGVSDGGFITVEGLSLEEVLGNTGHVITHVGKDLREELMALPKGTKVGVQYFDQFCYQGMPDRRRSTKIGKEFKIPKHVVGYWTEILQLCKMGGLDVVLLDDYASLRQISKKLVEKERDIQGIKTSERTIALEPDDMGLERLKREQTEKLYRTEVEIEHIDTVKRSEGILKNIMDKNPEVVIVARMHGDYFKANPELMQTLQVKFENYAIEQYDAKMELKNLPEYFARPQIFGKLVQNAEPDKNILAAREKVVRQDKALNLGRILVSKSPRWIGTWSVDIPARGLFEVYVEDEIKTFHGVTAYRGTIEDIFGTAKFIGSVDSKTRTLILEKQYSPEAIAIGGSAGPVKYDVDITPRIGEENGKQVFEGRYTPPGTRPKMFRMREFKSEDSRLEKFRIP